MIGGQKRTGQYFDGSLEDGYVIKRAKLELPSLTQDGAIRLQIAPSFGQFDYVLDFTPQPSGCLMWRRNRNLSLTEVKNSCQIIAVSVWRSASENVGALKSLEKRRFFVPEEDYRDAILSFNERLKNWHGRRLGMADGTWLGLEQLHRGKVGSMTANAGEWSSDNPLSQLVRDVQRLAIAYGPTGFFPRSYDWHNLSDPDYACGMGFAGADPDGMGAGGDVCAALLKAKPR